MVPIFWLSPFFSVHNYFSWIVERKLRCESVGCPPLSGGWSLHVSMVCLLLEVLLLLVCCNNAFSFTVEPALMLFTVTM